MKSIVTIDQFAQAAQHIHGLNRQWWHDINTDARLDRNKGELIALVHSEVSESYDGYEGQLMDDHLSHRFMAEVEMADAIIRIMDFIGGFGFERDCGFCFLESRKRNQFHPGNEVAMFAQIQSKISAWLECERKHKPSKQAIADVLSAIEQFCSYMNYDLEGAIEEKLAYNQQRADHKREKRLEEGGKKF